VKLVVIGGTGLIGPKSHPARAERGKDPRKVAVAADAHARYSGAELDEHTLVPGTTRYSVRRPSMNGSRKALARTPVGAQPWRVDREALATAPRARYRVAVPRPVVASLCALSVLVASGCELAASFDRKKIPPPQAHVPMIPSNGGDHEPTPPNMAEDAGPLDGSVGDGGLDASPDAQVPADAEARPSDAATDAAISDAAVDGGSDAGSDAGEADASTDAAAAPADAGG
jgi:hypothetical protein